MDFMLLDWMSGGGGEMVKITREKRGEKCNNF